MIKLRLCEHHKVPGQIEELITAIVSVPNSCDEVWLASDYGYPKLEVIKENAKKMKIANEKFLNAGIKVSLQISNTIGHGEYIKFRDCSGLVYEGSPVGNLVGDDGTVAKYCFCYNDEYFQKYICEAVKEYSKFMPFSVWFDDDLRSTNHHPVDRGCFCDNCLKKFNEQNDTNFSREQLVYEMNYGNISIREKYITFIKKSLSNLVTLISNAVMEVSPNSNLAYQYSTTHFTGNDVNYIFEAFKKVNKKAPLSRPGGGFYTDQNPYGMVQKAQYLQHENTLVADFVEQRCAEIENTPDVAFGKTIYTTCLESSLYLVCGCNALSYASLMNPYEPISWHKKMFEMFSLHKPYWERLISHNKNAQNAGVCFFMSDNSYKKPAKEKFDWTKDFCHKPLEMMKIGMPLTYNKKIGCCYLLAGELVDYLTDEDIEFLLNKAVIADSYALENLEKRGYSSCFNALTKRFDCCGYQEVFSNHRVNEDFCGKRWGASMFNGGTSNVHIIVPKDDKIEEISHFINRTNNQISGCANAIITTKYDKKWAIMSYGLWDDILSFDKRNQVLNVMDYISALPAIVKNPEQICVYPQISEEGKIVSVSLLNCGIQETQELNLVIRNPIGETFINANPFDKDVKLEYTKKNEDYILKVAPLKGWHITTIFISR